jgi:catalase-peroxidase
MNWAVNKPNQLQSVLAVLEAIAKDFEVSVADTIIIGGAVGLEMASSWMS